MPYGTVEFEAAPEGLKQYDRSLYAREDVIVTAALLADATVTTGTDKLRLDQWSARIGHHYFCSICGIYTHHQRPKNSNEYGYNIAYIDLASFGDTPMTDGISMTDESSN